MSVILALTSVVIMVNTKHCDRKERENGQCSTGKGGKKSKNSQKNAPPQWQREPPAESHLDFRENALVELNCAIKGTPEPEFYWLSGRKRIDQKNTGKYEMTKGNLTIFNVKIIDSGPYTCIAENSFGQLNFTYEIRVLENMPLNDIDVVDRPVNQTAQVGDTVVFQCTSDDWPRPKIFWTRRRDSQNIFEVLSSPDKEDTLVIHNVTKNDQGLYTCNIENSGTRKEFSGSLRVIQQGEVLQTEPKCSMHLIREVYIDHATGCNTSQAVDLYYCMGSCGRSYYMPKIVVTDQLSKIEKADNVIAQTCNCCVGKLETVKIVEMECPLRQKSLAYIPVLHRCECRPCGGGGGAGVERKQMRKNDRRSQLLRDGKPRPKKKKKSTKKPPQNRQRIL
ncbi:Contactin-6 [Bulinus truncatus]|nr:Contactin-6 [Bulinus truncatus]